MNDQFISKELALWLKGRGCKIKTDWWYSDAPTNGHDWDICHACELSEFHMKDAVPAYSWYSILVTHAKEFWGEKEVNNQNNTWRIRATKRRAAEAYVREHSLFANS